MADSIKKRFLFLSKRHLYWKLIALIFITGSILAVVLIKNPQIYRSLAFFGKGSPKKQQCGFYSQACCAPDTEDDNSIINDQGCAKDLKCYQLADETIGHCYNLSNVCGQLDTPCCLARSGEECSLGQYCKDAGEYTGPENPWGTGFCKNTQQSCGKKHEACCGKDGDKTHGEEGRCEETSDFCTNYNYCEEGLAQVNIWGEDFPYNTGRNTFRKGEKLTMEIVSNVKGTVVSKESMVEGLLPPYAAFLSRSLEIITSGIRLSSPATDFWTREVGTKIIGGVLTIATDDYGTYYQAASRESHLVTNHTPNYYLTNKTIYVVDYNQPIEARPTGSACIFPFKCHKYECPQGYTPADFSCNMADSVCCAPPGFIEPTPTPLPTLTPEPTAHPSDECTLPNSCHKYECPEDYTEVPGFCRMADSVCCRPSD